jgi:hypothetical protein
MRVKLDISIIDDTTTLAELENFGILKKGVELAYHKTFEDILQEICSESGCTFTIDVKAED